MVRETLTLVAGLGLPAYSGVLKALFPIRSLFFNERQTGLRDIPHLTPDRIYFVLFLSRILLRDSQPAFWQGSSIDFVL